MMILIILFLFTGAQALHNSRKSVAEFVEGNGYPFEEHKVVTADGYILTVHRIPHGRNSTVIGRPVILQHGIMCSSISWMLSRVDKALAFILAEEGYDVWATNTRGNTYGKEHKYLNSNEAKFWDFSFHEMGYYDMPAIIDYILEKTNHSKVHYVGHSMGTTLFFVMASSRPEYNEKIAHMSALAPIVYLQDTKGTVKNLLAIANELIFLTRLTGTYEFLDNSKFVKWVEKELCRAGSFRETICENILYIVAGFDSQEMNKTLLPIISEYTPEGISAKVLIHYGQIAKSGGKFQLYDKGFIENLIDYGQWHPPQYNLSEVTAQVTLHYADNDWLAGVKDVKKLNSILPNSNAVLVPFYYFNHLDYVWAIDVVDLLYTDMINIMNQY